MNNEKCYVLKLGVVDYRKAHELQRALLQDHLDGKGSNSLLLLQHNPVITVGRGGDRDNILVSRSVLTKAGEP